MNAFRIVTLPGVICFADEDFTDKESPLTLYLDLRSHLAHHLVVPQIEIGRIRIMKVVTWFFVRSFLACHYETLAALNLSLRDTLKGPDFFHRNADMSLRRTQIQAKVSTEKWTPIEGALPAEEIRLYSTRFLHRAIMKLTLNGHLLPMFSRFGNHIILPANMRGRRRQIWGASQITYISTDGSRAYTVRHSKARAWREAVAYSQAAWTLWRTYPKLRDTWRNGYVELTGEAFWRQILKLPPKGPGL